MEKVKINGKVVSGIGVGFEGCHKIYILENEEDKKLLIDYGYEIYKLKQLKDIWECSCPLRFISSVDLKTTFVEQCSNATIEYIGHQK